MKSNTKIEKQLGKKSNSYLVDTIIAAKKNKKWHDVAETLSIPGRKRVEINLDKINESAKGNEILVFPGKILSMGEVDRKFKVAALSFSEKAREKLNKAGCETLSILEEIKKNPGAKGVKILK